MVTTRAPVLSTFLRAIKGSAGWLSYHSDASPPWSASFLVEEGVSMCQKKIIGAGDVLRGEVMLGIFGFRGLCLWTVQAIKCGKQTSMLLWPSKLWFPEPSPKKPLRLAMDEMHPAFCEAWVLMWRIWEQCQYLSIETWSASPSTRENFLQGILFRVKHAVLWKDDHKLLRMMLYLCAYSQEGCATKMWDTALYTLTEGLHSRQGFPTLR